VDYRIKPHVPPFEQIPANSVKFQPCDCTAQAGYFTLVYIYQYPSFTVQTNWVSNPFRSLHFRDFSVNLILFLFFKMVVPVNYKHFIANLQVQEISIKY